MVELELVQSERGSSDRWQIRLLSTRRPRILLTSIPLDPICRDQTVRTTIDMHFDVSHHRIHSAWTHHEHGVMTHRMRIRHNAI
jgi:hypothetical protein